ncbi:MAG: hypothetical protein B0A82_00100 [Alkalinema sp. CACIAM 70d]|nr:MAG: hypothetical protein B0A82_00100 [Alkalinema sp. CACIAM 70d]
MSDQSQSKAPQIVESTSPEPNVRDAYTSDANASTLETAPTEQKASIRLHHLDGMRGLAALYVLLHHAYLQVTWEPEKIQLPAWVWASSQWLEWGNFAVVVFIILSGYCLTLPIVQSRQLKRGFWHYIKRRAKRMIPPYYAALVVSLILIALLPILRQHSGTIWDAAVPVKLGHIVTHALLLHNILGGIARIDYPLWTISTEWQLYFALPLVLLPLWRRFGLKVMLGVAIVAGYLPVILTGHLPIEAIHHKLAEVKLWYFSHFAFGVTAAVISRSQDPKIVTLRSRLPWGWMSAGISSLIIAICLPQSRDALAASEMSTDFLVSLAAFSFLIYASQPRSNSVALNILNHPWIFKLGIFSYSLYLIHAPFLAAFDVSLLTAGFSPIQRLVLDLTIAPVLIIAIAYGFYWLVERHFLNNPADKKSMPTA